MGNLEVILNSTQLSNSQMGHKQWGGVAFKDVHSYDVGIAVFQNESHMMRISDQLHGELNEVMSGSLSARSIYAIVEMTATHIQS